MISKIKKDIFIVIELINPKNVSFLYNKGRDQNDEYRFINKQMNIDSTGSFAVGEVYFSSIMDNLITQAYYNQSLLAVLKKIILGEDQTTYKKSPLYRYRDVVSANLYLIDFSATLKSKLNINLANNTNNFGLLKENSNKDHLISFNKDFSPNHINFNNVNPNLFGSNKDVLSIRVYIAVCICILETYRRVFIVVAGKTALVADHITAVY